MDKKKYCECCFPDAQLYLLSNSEVYAFNMDIRGGQGYSIYGSDTPSADMPIPGMGVVVHTGAKL